MKQIKMRVLTDPPYTNASFVRVSVNGIEVDCPVMSADGNRLRLKVLGKDYGFTIDPRTGRPDQYTTFGR